MKSHLPICDIILLSWNLVEYIKPCVESIIQHTGLPSKLFIIDNGSGEETKAYLRTLKSTPLIEIEVIFNSENKGFVGGMNQGMKLSKAPFICLLNNDTLVTPRWLDICLDAFKNPQVGIVNPHSSTFGIWPKKGQTADDVAKELFEKHKEHPVIEIGSGVGFCMFIRQDVMNKIGYLEESLYKIFFEDSDYSKRAKEAGYLCVGARQAYVFHHEHKTLSKKSDRDVFFKKNQAWFYEKWGKPLRIFWPKKSPLTLEDQKKLTELARHDHFLYVTLPLPSKDSWPDRHSHIELKPIGSFKKLDYFYFFWRTLFKSRKKPYHYVIANDYPLLKTIGFLTKSKFVDRLTDIGA